MLLDILGRTEVARGSLPLSPGSSLTWAGFSKDGMAMTMDSVGVLAGLTPSFGGAWSPLLDCRLALKNT